ncbi:MAG: MFS transporter, partial [Lentisphaeria bacterium]|nr:MFS transporter [Lentisphaeria bacterium]
MPTRSAIFPQDDSSEAENRVLPWFRHDMESPPAPRQAAVAASVRLGTRYAVLAAVVLIQGCLGGIYAWSTFVPALHGTWGLGMAQTQLLFGGLIGVFTLAMIPAGRLLRRVGPKPVAVFGGSLFAVGFLLAAASGGRFGILFVGISLLAGTGTGCCYVCALTSGAAWFPERKGLVTGLAVAGFGGGAVVLAFLGQWLLTRGMDVLRVLGVVGAMYGVVIVCAAWLLSLP